MTSDAVSPPAVKWRGTLAVLALVIAAVGIAQTSVGHALLRRAGLFEQSATYTSLAFQHPQFPPQLTSRRAAVPVSFVIANAGGTSRTYQWTLSLTQGTLTRRLATGSIRLAAGHRAALTEVAHVVCTQQKQVSLVVSLAHPAESIHAWAACPPGPRSSS